MIDVIKKMARAISAEGGFKSETYPETLAQAAYTAMMQHLAETGQVIVPEEPRHKQATAASEVLRDAGFSGDSYHTARLMLRAALKGENSNGT